MGAHAKKNPNVKEKTPKQYKQMGLSEDNVKTASHLFREAPGLPRVEDCTKAELVFGYSMVRLQRSKALKVLGTTEDMIDENQSKALSALGIDGRRRSFELSPQPELRRVLTSLTQKLGFAHNTRRRSTSTAW
jgi:hypothetical protein